MIPCQLAEKYPPEYTTANPVDKIDRPAVGLDPPDEQPAGVDAVALPVLAALADGPRTADELALLTGLAAGAVAAALVGLELDGRVAAADGTYRSTIAR